MKGFKRFQKVLEGSERFQWMRSSIRFYQVLPGFMIFQKIPPVFKRFQLVLEGFVRFWLIIMTLSPPSTKQALASWEACEYSLLGVIFLGKAHGMSRLPFESIRFSTGSFVLYLWGQPFHLTKYLNACLPCGASESMMLSTSYMSGSSISAPTTGPGRWLFWPGTRSWAVRCNKETWKTECI